MSLKARTIFGSVMTILMVALILFGPEKKIDQGVRIGGGAILLFWVSHLYLWWRTRKDMSADVHNG